MAVYACAPYHILDIGSWTDTPFAEHGAALSCAVTLYSRVALNPREHPGLSLRTRQSTQNPIINAGSPPKQTDSNVISLFKAAAKYFEADGIDASVSFDLPDRSDTGIIAATAVALTGALAASVGKYLPPHQIAIIAHQLQAEIFGQFCGLQSHIAATSGGIAYHRFDPYPRVFTTPLLLEKDLLAELERRLLLVHVHQSIPGTFLDRLAQRYQDGDRKTREVIWELRALPSKAKEAIVHRDFAALGAIMSTHMVLQQQLCPSIFSPEIHRIKTIAEACGALAVKANSTGGSLTILCDPDSTRSIAEAVTQAGSPVVPVHIDHTGLRVWRSIPSDRRTATPVYETSDAA